MSALPLQSNTLWQIFEDRKSTRLNSSHLVISYAVFCLKKKKSRGVGAPARERARILEDSYRSRGEAVARTRGRVDHQPGRSGSGHFLGAAAQCGRLSVR